MRLMEKKIQKLFGKIKAHKNPAERVYYPVNNNDATMEENISSSCI